MCLFIKKKHAAEVQGSKYHIIKHTSSFLEMFLLVLCISFPKRIIQFNQWDSYSGWVSHGVYDMQLKKNKQNNNK